MKTYRLVSIPEVDSDVESAFTWYENERGDLGLDFLNEVRAAYDRIAEYPLQYEEIYSDVRRALTRRFPYAVYFTIDGDSAVVFAILHASRDPAVWQSRPR